MIINYCFAGGESVSVILEAIFNEETRFLFRLGWDGEMLAWY